MPPLVSLLNDENVDSANDYESYLIICNMRIKALKVIDLFFNFHAYLRLQVSNNFI